jgi:hypothetical protein
LWFLPHTVSVQDKTRPDKATEDRQNARQLKAQDKTQRCTQALQAQAFVVYFCFDCQLSYHDLLYRSGKLEESFAKKRFNQLFDHAFLSTHAVHHLGHEGARNVLKKGALVTVESPRYLFQLDKEQKQEFVKRTHALATAKSKLESLGSATCQHTWTTSFKQHQSYS